MTPAATCVARTVAGTEVASHWSGWKAGVEITAPSACSLHADCTFHPSWSGVVVPANADAASAAVRSVRSFSLCMLACFSAGDPDVVHFVPCAGDVADLEKQQVLRLRFTSFRFAQDDKFSGGAMLRRSEVVFQCHLE